MLVKVNTRIQPPQRLMKGLGIQTTGRVQNFLTSRVLFHMKRFMPWREGTMASAQTMQISPTMIAVNAPQARYLYHGVKLHDPVNGGPFPIKDANGEFQGEFRYRKGAHPVPTGEPLEYTHTTNPLAGPYWDRTMVQHDGAQISREVAQYIRRLKG